MKNNFCPFIKGSCRNDCVFRCNNVAVGDKVLNCLLAIKLFDINEYQHDDLTEIINTLKNK